MLDVQMWNFRSFFHCKVEIIITYCVGISSFEYCKHQISHSVYHKHTFSYPLNDVMHLCSFTSLVKKATHSSAISDWMTLVIPMRTVQVWFLHSCIQEVHVSINRLYYILSARPSKYPNLRHPRRVSCMDS